MSIHGVQFMRRFLRHLLPPRLQHIRRYGFMGARLAPEKRAWLPSHFGLPDPSASQGAQGERGDETESSALEEEPSRPCRYCSGTPYLTERTQRPRVIESMWMPWKRFDLARPGPIVTLGANVPDARAGSARSTPRHDAADHPPEACCGCAGEHS